MGDEPIHDDITLFACGQPSHTRLVNRDSIDDCINRDQREGDNSRTAHCIVRPNDRVLNDIRQQEHHDNIEGIHRSKASFPAESEDDDQ